MTLRDYWEANYQELDGKPMGELVAVCCPQAPIGYNRMFEAFQRRTVNKLLAQAGALPSRRILDLGCGFGRWSALLQGQGARVIGVDHVLRPLLRSRERVGDGVFAQMEVSRLGLVDSCLDGSVGVTVLQHLPPPAQRLAVLELARCVKAGGFVLLLEHTIQSRAQIGVPRTTFSNTPQSWSELFTSAGFTLEGQRPCLVLPLFRLYWGVRDTLRRRVYRRAGPGAKSPERSDQTLKSAYSRLNFVVYAVLTPPSFLLELVLEAVPPLQRLIARLVPVAHRGFLFRRLA